MPTPEQFLSTRQRYQPIAFPQHVSEEAIARDWTLSEQDRAELEQVSHTRSACLWPFNSVRCVSMGVFSPRSMRSPPTLSITWAISLGCRPPWRSTSRSGKRRIRSIASRF